MAFVDDLAAPVLDPDDHHHLARVLRVREGEPMVVCDSAGAWRTARFAEHPHDLGEVHCAARRSPVLTLAFTVVKGDRPELVVEKATELGVDRMVPILSDHAVVRWDAARARRQVERFARIVRGASMQCRRTWLPEVGPLTAFTDVIAGNGVVLLADAGGRALSASMLADDVAERDGVTIMIGPEGGWSEGERAAARAAAVPTVRLGDHILRAETAAITASALLAALRANG